MMYVRGLIKKKVLMLTFGSLSLVLFGMKVRMKKDVPVSALKFMEMELIAFLMTY
jgi:hypothetical protein